MGTGLQIREIILRAGYDLPEGAILPPLDLVDGEMGKLAAGVSKLAVALGREAGFHVCATLAPKARSFGEIRRAVGELLLMAAGVAVQLGLEPEGLLVELLADSRAASAVLTGENREVCPMCKGVPVSDEPGCLGCLDCDFHGTREGYEAMQAMMAEGFAAHAEYVRRGICDGCGAKSLCEAQTMCRPRRIGDSQEYGCDGDILWEEERTRAEEAEDAGDDALLGEDEGVIEPLNEKRL